MKIKIPEFEEYIESHSIHYRSWSPEEEDVLARYYGLIPPKVLAKRLGRTVKSIRDKADAMGISAKENQEKFNLIPRDDSDESLLYEQD